MTAQAPSAASAVWTLAGLTLRRMIRGRALWIGALIAALPAGFAVAMSARRGEVSTTAILYVTTPILVLLPPLFVASSISDEIEGRTITYLWSRPIARWAVIAGKLCALVPIAAALVAGGWYAAVAVGVHAAPPAMSGPAMALGCAAISLVVAGLATVVPRHGMALAIAYMMIDSFFGALPFSLAELSLTHQTRILAHVGDGPYDPAHPLVAMAIIAAIWTAIGLGRIRRLEA